MVAMLVVALSGTALAARLSGTAGDDLIRGTSGDDVLQGLAGDDALYGIIGGNNFLTSSTASWSTSPLKVLATLTRASLVPSRSS